MAAHFCHNNTHHRTVGTASGGTGRENVAVGSVWQHISVISKFCVQTTEHFHTITQKDIADNFTWKNKTNTCSDEKKKSPRIYLSKFHKQIMNLL